MIELTIEESSLLRKFRRCVDSRSIEKMDKKLYHFFMYECGFIAHYSIHGFKDEYSDTNYVRWFKNFSDPDWMFFHPNQKHENLKRACVLYAQKQKSAVLADFERKERNRKLRLFNALSAELGMSSTVKTNESITITSPEPLLQEEDNGQFALFG